MISRIWRHKDHNFVIRGANEKKKREKKVIRSLQSQLNKPFCHKKINTTHTTPHITVTGNTEEPGAPPNTACWCQEKACLRVSAAMAPTATAPAAIALGHKDLLDSSPLATSECWLSPPSERRWWDDICCCCCGVLLPWGREDWPLLRRVALRAVSK